MIDVKLLIKNIKKNKIKFFSGVPDSVLKNLTNILEKKEILHVKAVNEGAAVSLCIGNYLATKNIGCAYMQNSGLSNAINPLISIADRKVYSIPILLIIGWRGAPGLKDEPQHYKKGAITKTLLKILNIKNITINTNKDILKISKLVKYSKKKNIPVAILIKNNTLSNQKTFNKISKHKFVSRLKFLRLLIKNLDKNSRIISTTGYTSRELYSLRKSYNKLGKDFYVVGGMGHTSMISLGVALNKKKVFCIDGDGAMLMHFGSLRTIGFYKSRFFKHILLNNNCHESVGGQDSTFKGLNMKKISKFLGYKNYYLIKNEANINKTLKKFKNSNGPSLLEVLIKVGTEKNLVRPINFYKIKNNFMR